MLLNVNKILWVAPSDQKPQLQKFSESTLTKQSQEIVRQVKTLFYTFLFKIPLNINKFSGVAPLGQQPQLQKFLEGRDLWQPTATFWWRWEKKLLYPRKFV